MEIPFEIIKSNDTNGWLVFIHGFGGSRRMFKKQLDKFKEYFNILILDLPGHGESKSGISIEKGINIDNIAQKILDTLHGLNIIKANFIGISLGTLIVASIVRCEPQIIEKVILGGAVFGINTFLNILIHIINGIKTLLPSSFIISAFAYLMMPRHNHKTSRTFMIKESRHLGKKEFMSWYSLVIHNMNFIKDNIKELIKTQSLIVMGSQDYVFMHKVKKLASKYNLNFDVIEKCGHVCNIEKSSEFNNLALGFLLK